MNILLQTNRIGSFTEADGIGDAEQRLSSQPQEILKPLFGGRARPPARRPSDLGAPNSAVRAFQNPAKRAIVCRLHLVGSAGACQSFGGKVVSKGFYSHDSSRGRALLYIFMKRWGGVGTGWGEAG